MSEKWVTMALRLLCRMGIIWVSLFFRSLKSLHSRFATFVHAGKSLGECVFRFFKVSVSDEEPRCHIYLDDRVHGATAVGEEIGRNEYSPFKRCPDLLRVLSLISKLSSTKMQCRICLS